MAKTIPLSFSELFNSLPQDLNLKNDENGIAFSFQHPGYPTDAPIYRNPTELACWVLGYMTARAELEKEN